MDQFMNRLETFLTWPDRVLVSASRLCQCGFFYTKSGDTVECYQCHAKISNWKPEDDPLIRHIDVSPTCELALSQRGETPNGQTPNRQTNGRGEEIATRQERDSRQAIHTGNFFQNVENVVSEYSQIVDYKQADTRLASFTNKWPTEHPIGVPDLVAAGLYYVGPGDRVQCAWCKGRMYNWDVGDSAMGEHARHFPQCSFVKGVFSRTTANTQTNTQKREAQTQATSGGQAARIAEAMGFEKKLIEKALKTFPKESTPSTADLIDVLFDLEDKVETDEDEASISTQSPRQPLPQNESETGGESPSDEATNELEVLLAENLSLRQSRQCVVCYDECVSVVFLPCRHMVCCQECSAAVKHCPVCRELILGTISAPDY